MKNLLFLLVIVLLSGCKCVLSQIPPQYIYAGAGCQAPLPNYLGVVEVSDNCEIVSFIQTPSAGYLLDRNNKITNVTLKATDASGNSREIRFSVALVDTIKPILTVDTLLVQWEMEKMNEFYDLGDKIVQRQMDAMDRLVLDSNVFPADSFPGLLDTYQDSVFYKKILVTASFKNFEGVRERTVMFTDSLRFPMELNMSFYK